jgi:hypothetical protein
MTSMTRYRPQAALALFLIGIAARRDRLRPGGRDPAAGAHDDFSALVQRAGGSMSHSATYPDTYRALSAQRRMLQNGYLGAGGGSILMSIAQRRCSARRRGRWRRLSPRPLA